MSSLTADGGVSSPSQLFETGGTDEQTPLLQADIEEQAGRRRPSDDALPPAEGESDGESSKSASEETQSETPKSVAGVISVLLLGVLIANADTSFVLATYGVISSEFDDLGDASWLVTAYSLAISATLPVYGKMSDIYGRRSTLIVAYALFAVGCLLCGVGLSLWAVVLGRVIGGAGGAGMTALVSIVIADMVPLRDVASWRSYVNIAATVGRSLGGPVGGLLSDTVGWRWSFLGQCPLALIGIISIAWKIRGREPPSDAQANNEVKVSKLRRIDFLGSVTVAITTTAFLMALDLGGQKLPWSHPVIFGLFGCAAVFGVLFLIVEGYWAREPIFPLFLLVHRDVVTTYIILGVQTAAQLAVMFSVPLYFQVTARASTAAAGAHLFPAVVGNAVGGLMIGVLIKRSGRYKMTTLAGLLVACICYGLLIFFWRGNTNIWESLYIFPGGFGTGIVISTTFVGLSAGVDRSQIAIAGTGLYFSSNLGALVGLSVASSIIQTTLRKGLDRRLEGLPGKAEIMDRALADIEYVKSLRGRPREIVVGAYIQSLEYTHCASLAFSLIGFVVAVGMREHRLA